MVLEVKNLSKHFIAHTRGDVEISGFKNINFTLKKGEFLSIAGKSGSGKSSILKVLYRSYLPSGGDIDFYDNGTFIASITKASDSEVLDLRERYIGYVSQFLQVLPRISALNIVANPLIMQGESENKAREKAREMLSFFGIKESLFDISPLTFSGGEQQRVNIAKGIIAPKKLLLLDEPTASLDKENRAKVLEQLRALKKKGISMIGIFHDKESMEAISDNIYDIGEIK